MERYCFASICNFEFTWALQTTLLDVTPTSNISICGSTGSSGLHTFAVPTSRRRTVRETFLYAASLRPPSSQQCGQCAKEIILELGFKDCADTRVGVGSGRVGVQAFRPSGERQRVGIGVQMLRNPSVLFLDELTTGLGSTEP